MRRSRFVQRPAGWLAMGALVLLSVCGDPPTGAKSATERAVQLALAPSMNQVAQRAFSVVGASIDNVHVVLRNSVGAIVLDIVVPFPAGQDNVEIALPVMVHGESERFSVKFELRAGAATLFEGSEDVTAKPGVNTRTPTSVALAFVGPGAKATRVVVTPATATVVAGGTVPLSATAFDASGAVIADAMLSWSSTADNVVRVSAAGVATAQNVRGSATVIAQTPTGVSGSATVSVTLPAAKLVVKGGDAQTGTVGAALALPLVVQAQASDGVGVGGVAVTFAAGANGGSVAAATVTTDASGNASTALTLGTQAGKQSFTASAGALAAVGITATATRDVASVVALVSGDAQSDTVGRVLRAPFVVRVTDRFGNAAAGVTVTWTRTSGGGALATPTTVTDEAGEARATYTLGGTPGGESVTASIGGAANNVTFQATALPRAASRIVAVSGGDQRGVVGAAGGAPLVVRVTDDAGNASIGATVAWTASNGATVSAATSVADASGRTQVTFTNPTKPGAFAVVARLGTSSTGGVQFDLAASVGPAASLAIAAGDGQTAAGGAAVAIAPAVTVTDRFGNPVPNVAVTFTPANGGSVSGSPASTNAQGVATLGSWTLGPSAGAQALTATVGSLSVRFSATASVAVTPVLSVSQQPSVSVMSGGLFITQPQVQLRTAAGAALPTSGVVVTVALKYAGPVLRGTLTATTDAAGVATFSTLSVKGVKGANALSFTAPGYTTDTSLTFKIRAGAPVAIAASSATSLSGVVNTVASPNPTVFASDSSGNGVAGVGVVFTVADTADGVVVGGSAVTDTMGVASPTSWTLGRGVRPDTLTATSAGMTGSPVRFIASATVGAVSQLVKISGDAQMGVTGNSLPAPMVVEARDALGNAVSGVSIGFSVIAGGGTPASQSVVTDAAGRASFALTLGAPGADTVKACLPSCATAQVLFSALSIPVGADAIWNGSASTLWTTAANWSPAVVPTASNNVFIPAGTPNAPALGVTTNINDLTLAAGATLNTNAMQLAIGGNVSATGATMTGTGYLYFCGGSHTITGGVAAVVADCSATVTPIGNVAASGGLTVQGSAVFDVASGVMTVAGNMDFPSSSGGRLKMITPGGKLSVAGSAYFGALDNGDGWLTDGTLEVKGNFTAQNYGSAFRAAGNHLTRLNGTSAQSVYFQYSGGSYSQFGQLEVTNPAGVTLTSDAVVVGNALVTSGAVVSGAYTISIGGLFTSQSGSNLSGLSAINVYSGGNTFPQLSGSGPANVNFVNGAVVNAPAAPVNLPTSLALYSSAQLVIGAGDVTINGNLTYPSGQGSRLNMTTAGGKLTVTGNAYFGALDNGDGWLTEGTLDLKGNFTAQNYGSAFRASGNHLTRFSGTSAQSVYFQYSGGTYSQFGNLEVTNTTGVTLTSDAVVVGAALVKTNAVISGAYTISIGGLFTSQSGSNLSGLSQINVYGGGNTFPLLSGSGPGVVNFVSGAVVNAPAAPVNLPTSLALYSSAQLVIGSGDVTINGNLTYPSGQGSRLNMTTAGGKLTVTGNAYFGALDNGDGWLTEGTLDLKGNFTAQNYGSAFRAAGNHLTRFSGTGSQSIYFQYTGGSYSQFANLEITNASASGVTPTSTATVVGGLNQLGRLTYTSIALNITGFVTLGPTSITNISGGLNSAGCSYTAGAIFSGFSCTLVP